MESIECCCNVVRLCKSSCLKIMRGVFSTQYLHTCIHTNRHINVFVILSEKFNVCIYLLQNEKMYLHTRTPEELRRNKTITSKIIQRYWCHIVINGCLSPTEYVSNPRQCCFNYNTKNTFELSNPGIESEISFRQHRTTKLQTRLKI